ncbi:phosphoglycerol transferase alkaline phosphatase superfamily protein [Levilactobacillus senmaizukei DSM 21775 = NBRC 103853]|uniref:Phosphoglycerol transferase alkaline phosphatase superfamily protein n=2 Tax=Levilactobacillus senmaizukei TaxID=431273 RepID=A0A0R2DRE3_9LACO|nr:phosphoglycerol transferase alkaline phosphatase superfamily protein [Levilactobacillus senmaizukei DSM 21775 = NBRC 103853]
MGFVTLLVVLFWLKTLLAYFVDFRLNLSDPFQFLIVLLNPIATTLLLFGLALFFKRARFFYPFLFLIDILNTLLLYINVIYFREFTDFMTVSTMLGYSKVDQGLSGSSLALTSPHDLLYWLDLVLVLALLATRRIYIDPRPLNKRVGFAVMSVAFLTFAVNLTLGEMDRPQLLTRTFDRTYVVKYLGLDAFTVYDGIKSQHTSELRSHAKKSELSGILKYVHKNYAAPDKQLYGVAKQKNVIVIHLESFQQFLINKKVNGQEVTPFLNKIYKSRSTYSFDNFFHEVGQGKTSDAETMLETGTYGLPQGSLFTQLGNDNTFQAAPAIFNQQGYSSAVFHGNVASFWNRSNTYKNLGYQNFFDASYYDTSGDKSLGYGLKDKLLFKDSVKYLQHLQQPFYVKYLTVTNHFPFTLDQEDSTFKTPDTGDKTVDNYFKTAHYLDQSVKEFYAYLNKSGLAKHSLIMIYGDHYGISNSSNKSLAKLLGVNPDDWNDYDNAQLQRVPMMFNMPGYTKGKIEHTYGGEIDVLPTLLHLMGISSKKYLQFGTDLLSRDHNPIVAFRNRDWETPDYTSVDGTIYSNQTQQEIHPTGKLKTKIEQIQQHVNQGLNYSDSLNQKNLLRFYHPRGFKAVDPQDYNYADGLSKAEKLEKKLGLKSTSLFSRNSDRSTEKLYVTDAPEANHKSTDSNRIKITNQDDTSGK